MIAPVRIMPAEPVDQSLLQEVEGEHELDSWLQSVPSDNQFISPIRAATTEQIEEVLESFIELEAKLLFYRPNGPQLFGVNTPPTVLRDALFDVSVKKPKKVRRDIKDIHGNIPLARFLLLACARM